MARVPKQVQDANRAAFDVAFEEVETDSGTALAPVNVITTPAGVSLPVSLSGRNLLDDEVVALTGEIQQLANIPSAATIVRLTVEYVPAAGEVGGIRFRELGKDPSVNGEFVAGGESVVIGFTHEALEALRFILVGPGTGRVIAKYY